jgi:hypothetical protein
VELETSLKEVNKRKKIHKMDKRNNEVIGAPPLNWPWFECFNNIFFNNAKISGIPNAIDQGVHVMNVKIKFVNVSDEKDVGTL